MMTRRTFLPQLQEDETIYSWCAAAHAMSGWRSAQGWSEAMLGAAHGPRQLDLPAYLPVLLNGALPRLTLEQALRRHSTAGMFLPFVKATMMARLRERGGAPHAAWPDPPQLMRKALFCHSRTLSWKPELRYCPECALADVARIGRAYWHAPHQWPVSRYCTAHLMPLMPSHASTKTWHQPPTSVNNAGTICPRSGNASISMVIQCVATAVSLLDTINTKALRAAALLRLKHLGVIHSMHAVRHARLHAWYRAQPVADWCADGRSSLAALADPDWIPKLLWKRTQDHPIRWIVMWSALEWADGETAAKALRDAVHGLTSDEDGQLPLFDGEGGAPPGGFSPAPTAFRLALETETSYATLMARVSASRSDIVRWLEADPISRQKWRERLQCARVMEAEQALTQQIQSHPHLSRDEVNAIANKEVRLLRQHAPERLAALLGAIPSKMDAQRPLWIECPFTR